MEASLSSNVGQKPLLAKGPFWLGSLSATLAAVVGAMVDVFSSWWKLIPIAVCVVFLILAFVIQLARHQFNEHAERTMARYIDSQLSPMMQKVGYTVAESSAPKRREHASSVLQSVVNAASEMIGPHPVRASIFEYDDDAEKMNAHPTAFAGRHHRSGRIYSSESPSLVRALAGLPRFVPNAQNEELSYRTYMTHPIIAGENLYGILSIDSPNVGDIHAEDEALLQFFSAVAALPYAAGKAPSRTVCRPNVP